VKIAKRTLAYVVLALIGVVAVAPLAYLLLLSTKRRIDIITEIPPSLHIDWAVVKENYDEVLHLQGMLVFSVNSVIVVAAATAIALVLGIPAAYGFSRLRFRGSEGAASWILSLRFMPPVAVAVAIYFMVRDVGLANTRPGLILPYAAFSLPLVVWIMIGFFDEIPREIDESARVDGCGRLGALRHVILPLARPGIWTAALFGAIFIWNEFLVALFVINSRDLQTITLGAATLVSAQRPIDWNIAAAVGVVTVVPMLAFSLFVQRYIVRGLTAGAIK
jgi:multiple sugar transport system permease protein